MTGRGIKRAFTRDLAETFIGGLILRFIIPLFSIAYGGLSIFRRQILIRSADVHGAPALWFGAAFVVLGLAIFGYPTIADIQEGRVSRLTTVRMRGGMLLFLLLMIGFGVSLF
jgi:hypothetical protein